MKPRRHRFWIASGIAFCCLAMTGPTEAQIVPDATLGAESSVVTPINRLPSDRINGGAIRGANVFHSFQEFNVDEGRGAYFTNPAGIENILSRVTGGNPSNILGTLGVSGGNANLFLINPNGIIFGPNASLDVGGSFVATTANAIQFGNQGFFNASAPDVPPLLTVNPSAFFFNQIAAQPITNQSVVGLQVPAGQSLLLLGGDVRLEGGRLNAPGGQADLGGVAGSGTVGLKVDGNNLNLSYPAGVQRADVSLTTGAEVDVTAGGGGSIVVNARNLDVSGQSRLVAGIETGLGSVGSQAGDITLNATGSMSIADSVIGSRVRSGSVGNGSNINIQASSLSLTNGAALIASVSGQGDAGSVAITATDTVSFDGLSSDGFPSGAFSSVDPGAVGNGGNVNLTAGSLSLTNGAQLSASTRGQGDAGSVTITASDVISFDGVGSNGLASGAFSSVDPGAVGDGGNVNLTAGSLFVTNGAQVSASTFGQGDAGNLSVLATGSVELIGTSADAQFPSGLFTQTLGAGAAGDLKVATGRLIVRDRAEASVSSQGSGEAGELQVAARSIQLDNQAALTAESASSEGGNITLQDQDLLLMRRNSQISTTAGTAGAGGNGGNIDIDTQFLVAVPSENSDITANALQGNGGRVQITAGGIFGTQFRERLTLESDITASSELGIDGVVAINTPDINPSRGLVNLPAQPTAAEVAQGCQAGGGQNKSEFVVTGRGGLPPSPDEALSSDAVIVGLVTPAQLAAIPPSPPKFNNSTAPVPDTIVEAQGWVIGPKGEVVLTATAPSKPITKGLPTTEQLVQQGRTLYYAKRFSESARVWQQAAAAFKTTGDELRQAMMLSNLSLAYQQLGQWPQATEAITESLKLLQTGRNMGTSNERMRKAHAYGTQILAQTLDIQGRQQLAQGQAESALTTWLKAVDTYAQVGDRAGVTRSRINSAQALQAKGLYRRAQKTLTESTHLLQKEPDSLLKATGLRSLGNVLQVVGNLEQSRQVLEQSLSVATQSQSPQAISDALLSLGNTARAQQDTQVAINFYQQAATASASNETRIQAQLNQLSLFLETEQLNAAKALWPQIQSQIANLPPSRTAVYARINFAQSLMKLEMVLGKREKVKGSNSYPLPLTPSSSSIAQLLTTAVQQAKNIGDQRATSYSLGNLGKLYEQTQQWSEAQDLTQQALFIAQAINAPDIAYRWQWQLGRLLKDRGNIQMAIAAYTEALNNIKSLRSDLVAINPQFQFDFRDEVEPVYRQLVDLLLRTEVPSAPSQENLQKARQIIEDLQLAELENFLQCSLQDANQVEVDRVVNQDNQMGAVIYPIILKDRLEVILKLPQQPLRHYTTLVPQNEVENTLGQLRYNLQLPYTFREVSSLSQRMYNWLIRPIEADLAQNGVETLVFVLDGSLRNIPMAALYDGKHYLVEKYGVALTPSLQLLDPKPLERTQLKALTAGLTPAREVFGQYFPPLPTVERELDLIKSEVPSVTLLNQDFTSTALQNQIDNSPFSVVHLATHGQFSSNPDETFILTWDDRINVKQLKTLLRSRNQSRPDPIELLVLSACETADGDKRAALGLAGIAVGAGARSTLGSLWAVEDSSVADFMGQFYQLLANRTVTKAEALRRAQLVLLQQPQYRHPFYWAPYVLLGNWL